MKARNWSRDSFLRNLTSPAIVAPWSWKARFARSTPIIVSFISPSSPLRGFQHQHLGTLRCRLGRAATIPSRFFYAIRLPANNVLREKIAHRLTRPVGRPSQTKVKRFYEDFEYQAVSWDKARRVIAKIEWHPGELFPRVGFIVTNLPMEPDWVVRFYNQRGTAEQHIKMGYRLEPHLQTAVDCRREVLRFER